MAQKDQSEFISHILAGYNNSGASVYLGSALLDGRVIPEARVALPLRSFNRHGLIAGATGTGKTVTLQMVAHKLSHSGVPVLVMDIKGDLSGIAAAGALTATIKERTGLLGTTYAPSACPTEFLTLTGKPGTRLRATVSEFGPVLFSRVLSLNETQSGIVSILFKYADDNGLPLLDLKDFRQLLVFAGGQGKKEIQAGYGNITPASLSTIQRKIVELESQGGDLFFGERSFDVKDLLRKENGMGIVSVLRLHDMQDRPQLFSTFMLSLLAELYQSLPERGDADKPLLCLFIDEAHLIFNDAPKELLRQVETIVKLIRSKGVGLFFVTQNPSDIPAEILAQLGLKVQHALRAFTEKDRRSIRKAAENYPSSPYYDPAQLLTSLAIGEALVTGLNEKGIPTPLAAVALEPPPSRIGTLSPDEIRAVCDRSTIIASYNEEIDRESAFEMLSAKMNVSTENKPVTGEKTGRSRAEPSVLRKAGESLARQAGRTLAQELTRGLLGVLGLGGRRRSRFR